MKFYHEILVENTCLTIYIVLIAKGTISHNKATHDRETKKKYCLEITLKAMKYQ